MAEAVARDGNLGQLERDLASMAHHAGTDLDQTGLNAREGPVSDFLRQFGTLEEVAKVVSQRMKLKPDLVVTKALAGQGHRILAFLHVRLGCAALIVETDDPVRLHRQISDDEAQAGEQIATMPLDLGNHAASFAPGRRLVFEVMVEAANVVGWAAYGALQ